MNKSIEHEYLDLFVNETKEYLASLSEIVPRLEKDPKNKELLNEAIRFVHSIKGNAGIMGFEKISSIAHSAEDILEMIKEGKLNLNKRIIKTLYEIIDKLSNLVSIVESDETDAKADIVDLLRKLEKIKSEATSEEESKSYKLIEKSAKEALSFIENESEKTLKKEPLVQVNKENTASIKDNEQLLHECENVHKEKIMKLNDVEREKAIDILSRGFQIYKICLKFKETPMFALRYFVALQKIGELGEIVKAIPSGSEVSRAKTTYVTILAGIRKLQDLDEIIKEIPDLEHYEAFKVSLRNLGVKEEELKALKITSDRIAEIESFLKKVEEKETASSITVSDEYQATRKLKEVRVNVKTLDALFNLVGELVLVKSRLAAIISKYDMPGIKETLATFERLVSELQDEVMRMRLVPLQYIFRGLPRYISELADEYSKEVDVSFEGGEIALDRRVLEDLVEPLYTLIRIIVRDDIEVSSERIRKDKPSVATIRITASREGNHVILTIESDGRGIDSEEVKKRALELGLVPASTIDKISKDEALMLMTLPGFSLKNGKYTGLDTIKKSIEALGGTLEIYSKVDVETKFVLKIPVSMATLRALLVKLNGTPYAIPITNVVTTTKLEQGNNVGAARIIKYQDKILPMHDLSRLLGMSGDENKRYAVIIEKRGKLIALAVNEILGQEDIVVKPLSKILARVKGLSGATILGDGKVCLILDPLSLVP